jgi:UDP-N-acetylmuramyl pentapeptide phosphotransferase/UDP-N-acetylglucosamine-1-phosphate transferase
MPFLVVGFLATLLASVLIYLSKATHGRYSMDSTFGVQKMHVNPTPRVGGIAIMVGLVAAYSQAPSDVQPLMGPMLMAALPAFVAGLVEDLTKKVGVLPRLFATMFSGLVAMYLTGITMQDTGLPPLDWLLSFAPFAVIFTAVAVGGIANAVNIIDGFNGLAAGAVAIMVGALGFIALDVGDAPLAWTCFTVAAVALGFGVINWPYGKLFMGDGGAYLLGFLLAWLAVLLTMRNPQIDGFTPLLICAYPVLEVLFSVIRRRKREGHHPGQPDKAHLHHFIHRRFVPRIAPNATAALRNGLTSPFCWVYATLPSAWAVFFHGNTAMLAAGFVLAAFTYTVIYARLTQFSWCLRPLTVHHSAESRLLS